MMLRAFMEVANHRIHGIAGDSWSIGYRFGEAVAVCQRITLLWNGVKSEPPYVDSYKKQQELGFREGF